MADTASPAAPVEAKKENVKPEKPDEEAHKANLKKAEKAHADVMVKFNAAKAKLDIAQPNKSKDSPTSKRRAELIKSLQEIRESQKGGKAGRMNTMEQIKKEEEKMKSLMAEQKTARSRVAFKNTDEIDREIERLDKQVGTGMMKLVDEKKALADISALRKQRKGFSGFDDQEKKIEESKAKLKSLRATLDDPESRALADKYTKLQTELDGIKAEQDDAYKNINSLRDEKQRLHLEQQEKYAAIRKIKQDHYEQNKAVQNWEYQSRQKARERRAAEEAAFQKEKKKERAQKMLAEASDPAYLDEIRCAESVLRFLDPTFASEKAPLQAPSKFGAMAQRTVDATGIKGKAITKKDEEDYFAGTGGKKGKKGRKTTTAESPAAKYSCPPSVMENCDFLKVEPPMSAADIPGTVEKVKAKLAQWKADQETQTAKNIEKAKKEVERLDAEDSASPAASATPAHANGDGKNTAAADEGGSVKNEVDLSNEADADLAKDLKDASIEEKA